MRSPNPIPFFLAGLLLVCSITCAQEASEPIEKVRDIEITKPYLLIPCAPGRDESFLRVTSGEDWIQDILISLPKTEEEILFFGTLNVEKWMGKTLRLTASKVDADCDALEWVVGSDEIADIHHSYGEKYRPQFHFAPRRGWTNDPNGLIWDGEKYHLFYQHNPYSTSWGNMTWGHAVSCDLLHWEEGEDAIVPDKLGTIYSGSAVNDSQNSSGLAPEGEPGPLVAFYTYAGGHAFPPVPYTQGMAYSLNKGKSWTKYKNNPIIPNMIGTNRDPKVIWYEPTQTWIMALFLTGEQYALLKSKNLIDWEEICEIGPMGCGECPDIFELPVDGDQNQKKWVFWGGDGCYLIGEFDGENFTKEAGPFRSKYGGNDYAAQSFSGLPDGRRVQFSWMRWGEYPGMPFNQQFTVPREMSLKTTPEGIRLAFAPVKELETLRGEPIVSLTSKTVSAPKMTFENIPECFDLEMTLDVAQAKQIIIDFSSTRFVYNPQTGMINDVVPCQPVDGKVTFRVVVDRMSYEVFAADGVAQFASCFIPTDEALAAGKENKNALTIVAEEGTVGVENLTLWRLASVWSPEQ